MRQVVKSIRYGFTLLEIIVVIIVIGIMASMIMPRLGGNQQREYDLFVNRVNDVVLMFAHRVSTSNQASAIRFNPEFKTFELLTKVEDDGDYYWEFDPLAQPVTLPSWLEGEAVTIYIDGEITDTTQWPVTATPGETRPLIEVAIDWEEHTSLISLHPHAMGPNIWHDGVGIEPLMPIDLDAQGRGREEW